MRRLQGHEWRTLQKQLIITHHQIAKSGNVKIFCRHKITNQKFCHWLNDGEKEIFYKWKEKQINESND